VCWCAHEQAADKADVALLDSYLSGNIFGQKDLLVQI
jgi:hypothetical protein